MNSGGTAPGRLPPKAMILAAGRGERMRPLTDHWPKPLLEIGGRPLIEWHLRALADGGVREVVVNTAWRAGVLEQWLGDGSRWGVRLSVSREPPGALDTGGGVLHALPMLGDEPFCLINGDVWSDFDLARLPASPPGDAHLVMVPNPEHHPRGDWGLRGDQVVEDGGERRTYAGIAVLRPGLFAGHAAGAFPLTGPLKRAVAEGRVSGQLHEGLWSDVGTPERLRAARAVWARGTTDGGSSRRR